jgi:3',5'-cyclic AMP phosphodiesterase CpdA
MKDKPELVLTGGDLIMDSFGRDEARTKLQWDIFTKVLKDECGIPVRHTLGNHDIWGWNKEKSKTTGSEPRWGKKWACEALGLAKPYHSYDQAGWHFVHLDSTQPEGDGYYAKLEEEQMAWLVADLAAVKPETPVLIISHIPIVTICVALESKIEPQLKDHKVAGGVMHRDARQLKELFLKHRNVKVCLSGHLHLNERIEFNGVSYLCNGAVSGAWWKGKNGQTDAGYAIVDLYDDGTFENEYVNYGWAAVEG